MTRGRPATCALAAVVLCLVFSSLLSVGCGSDDFVSSPPFGTLVVVVTTDGTNLDPNGYQVGVIGPGLNVTRTVGVDETTTFFTFEAGTFTVQLADIAANCVVDGNPRTVVMALRSTTTITFAVTCS